MKETPFDFDNWASSAGVKLVAASYWRKQLMLNYKWGSIEDVVVMVVSGTGDRTRQSTTVWASRIEK
ncbi:hypothetical protein OUZ56_025199 [Daphnia magna]|uniref:Uncharacterized protein n=1 Tax=Daphnia magna TaxID=35525 RepID=A0ABQ9ZJ51_9CRUS|nr:hypothetical protein OUZ56_025199 [Daphnia magna]